MQNRVTAVFGDRTQAEQALQALRSLGVREDHMSLISQHNDDVVGANHVGDNDDAGSGALTGLAAGASVGALFGLGAALIPGVGPFITAGTLLYSALGAAGGGAAAGAIVGGTTGAVAGALARAGYDEHEAKYYGERIESGDVFLAVDAGDAVSLDQIRATMVQYGGRSAQIS